jgi:hypothetical protein
MQTMIYQGFANTSECQYAIGEEGGKKLVVFVQGPLTNTSITNMIEVLASRVLCADLAGTDPSDVRFFEYYPAHLNPIRAWQEVSFEERRPVDESTGLLAKLLQVLSGPTKPSAWCVDKPQWSALSERDVPPAARALVVR